MPCESTIGRLQDGSHWVLASQESTHQSCPFLDDRDDCSKPFDLRQGSSQGKALVSSVCAREDELQDLPISMTNLHMIEITMGISSTHIQSKFALESFQCFFTCYQYANGALGEVWKLLVKTPQTTCRHRSSTLFRRCSYRRVKVTVEPRCSILNFPVSKTRVEVLVASVQ